MKYIALLLISLVLISGCVQQEKPKFINDGIRINSFLIEPNEVRAGQRFTTTVEIENVGQTKTGTGSIELIGASWVTDSNSLKDSFQPLSAQDPQLSRPGSTIVRTFSLAAPTDLPEGVKQTYTITGRVKYGYKTSATAKITVLSEDEYLRRRAKGEIISTPIEVRNTFAPIVIDVIGSSPIVVPKTTGTEETFYKFILRNVGSGLPITNNVNGLVVGKISIDGQGASLSCFGATASANQYIPLSENENDANAVIIRQGSSATIPCSIRSSLAQDFNDININFEIEYIYYSDAKATLTAFGRKL